MSGQSLRVAATLVLAAAVSAIACGLPGDASEPIDRATARLEGGLADTPSPERNAAVRVFAGDIMCSGTLISPLRVLTAEHCTKDPAIAEKVTDFYYKYTPMGREVLFGVTETQRKTQKVVIQHGWRLSEKASTLETAFKEDIAVLALSSIPPSSFGVTPVHPWETTPSVVECPLSFSAMALGYGTLYPPDLSRGRVDGLPITCSMSQGCQSSGRIVVKGDSGGPIFATVSGRTLVCGALSGWIVNDVWAPSFLGINRDLVTATARTSAGLWVGEVPEGLNDRDGDLVPDDFDNCPDYPNPSQEDTDGDTIGDHCDNCPGQSNIFQEDTNLAAEEATIGLKKPTPGQVQLVRPIDYVFSRWPGDKCDNNPLLDLSPGGIYPTSPARTRTCTKRTRATGCVLMTNQQCDVGDGNRIEALGMLGKPETVGLEKLASNTAVRRCTCPEGIGTEGDCSDADNPDLRCPRGDMVTSVGPTARWQPVRLERFADRTLLRYGDYYIAAKHRVGDADEQELGWNYADDGFALGSPPDAGVVTSVFDGVLWTWVRNSTFGDTAPPVTNLPDPAETLRQVIVRAKLQEIGRTHQRDFVCDALDYRPLPRMPFWVPKPGGGWDEPCRVCGPQNLSIFHAIGTDPADSSPHVYVSHAAQDEADVTARFSSATLAALIDGASTIVMASDPPGVTGNVVGLRIGSAHSVSGKFTIDPTTNTLSYESASLGSGLGPLVAAFSRKRQQVAFVGEQDAQGAVLNSVRTHNFASGTEVVRALRDDGIRMQSPAAAVYHWADDAYYVLDRVTDAHGVAKLRLLRIGLEWRVDVVYEWVRAGTYPNLALTVSNDGVLVISSWSASGHNVARLALERWGPELVALDSATGALAGPAIAGRDGAFRIRMVDGRVGAPERLSQATPHSPLDLTALDSCF